MFKAPLTFLNGHLFASVGGHDWLLDTGAPTSFSSIPSQTIDNKAFSFTDGYMGLTAASLSEFVGHPTAGLMGADVLNCFDILLDVAKGEATFSESSIDLQGLILKTEEFMGIPVIEVSIEGTIRRMFFDSGAQISYFQDESLSDFPPAGSMTDFFPGMGEFQTDTNTVEILIGNESHHLRCGSLPGLLGMTLMMADVEGIIGNEILLNRKVGLFPRRQQLVLA